MRKRAGLARALAMDPEIVFFDEPSAGLDPVSAALLDELILELKENMGMTVVVVTHDLDSIFTIGNNSVFLDAATHTMITGGDPHVLRCDQTHPDIVRFLNLSLIHIYVSRKKGKSFGCTSLFRKISSLFISSIETTSSHAARQRRLQTRSAC